MSRKVAKVSKALLVMFVIGLSLILASLVSAIIVKNYAVVVVFSVLGAFVFYTFFIMYKDYMIAQRRKK